VFDMFFLKFVCIILLEAVRLMRKLEKQKSSERSQ